MRNINRETKIIPAVDGSPIKVFKPDLRFDFSPADTLGAVKALIEKHVGASQAITIEQIALELWAHEWMYVRPDSRTPDYIYRVRIQRLIKDTVRHLRLSGVRIGACRGSKNFPSGYFLISSAAEQEMSLKPLFSQAVDQLRTCSAMTGCDFGVPQLMANRHLLRVVPEAKP